MNAQNKQELQTLHALYPTHEEAAAEIARLSATAHLPKETEFFVSDIHGEFAAFSHILRNASGGIRELIDFVFEDGLSEDKKRTLASLVYYPEERVAIDAEAAIDEAAYYFGAIVELVALAHPLVLRHAAERVDDLLPLEYAALIRALLVHCHYAHKPEGTPEIAKSYEPDLYANALIDSAIETGIAPDIIVALAQLIQHLAVDHLHMVGDVYDRGPYPDLIMEELMRFPSIDIQWGNHDAVWMGAALGQWGCIAHVVRNCARYGNLSILEDAYGINILPLASFALDAYRDDPCVGFGLKGNPDLSPSELEMNVKIQKAMAIIQFKVEAALIDEYPEFGLESRKLLDKIDYEAGTVVVDGVEYPLTDRVFPTVDPQNPFALTPAEEEVMCRLEAAFTGCEKLQRHMRFFLEVGSLYKIRNGNLMFHACVPLNADGSLKEVDVFGRRYKGRALYDVMERYVRAAFFSHDAEESRRGRDLLWYLWLGEGSPLFAKSKMATFELYLIADKAARKEVKNPFYTLIEDERVIAGIFEDFGMDPETSHIVCGHVPVKVKDGEDPVKCGGRVFMIDGGFSRAYQPTTGIAGYTLIDNSYEFILAAHEPLKSAAAAVVEELDIHSSRRVVERVEHRTLVADTDDGADIRRRVEDLEQLLEAYRDGQIAEGGR